MLTHLFCFRSLASAPGERSKTLLKVFAHAEYGSERMRDNITVARPCQEVFRVNFLRFYKIPKSQTPTTPPHPLGRGRMHTGWKNIFPARVHPSASLINLAVVVRRGARRGAGHPGSDSS